MSESAPFWEKHQKIIGEMFAPVTDALIQDAQITADCAVLDVATGPGEPALSITEVIGPQGKVVGTDAVPEMIEAARREGHRLGLRNVSFEVALDDCLPFPANTFDSVVRYVDQCRIKTDWIDKPVSKERFSAVDRYRRE